MAGGLSAAEIIVVHSREIVVDKRKSMYHLDTGSRCSSVPEIAAASLAECVDEHRTDTFSACLERIVHRVDEVLLRNRVLGVLVVLPEVLLRKADIFLKFFLKTAVHNSFFRHICALILRDLDMCFIELLPALRRQSDSLAIELHCFLKRYIALFQLCDYLSEPFHIIFKCGLILHRITIFQ